MSWVSDQHDSATDACLGIQEDRGGAVAWWRRPPEAWGPGQRLLACGAQVIAELRAAVLEELGYSCSAGEGGTKLTLLVVSR